MHTFLLLVIALQSCRAHFSSKTDHSNTSHTHTNTMNITAAPPQNQRVVGQSYNCKGMIRIWKSGYWCCKHNKRTHLCFSCKDQKCRDISLKDTHPLLAKEWSHLNPPIENFSSGCSTSVQWICEDGHHWSSSIWKRVHGAGCLKCHVNSCRHYSEEESVELRTRSIPEAVRTKSLAVGEMTECWVLDKLQTRVDSRHIMAVKKVGQDGDKTDIAVTLLSGSIKSIQVKTIIALKDNPDTYNLAAFRKKYDDNMLFAMVNKERTRFAVAHYKDLKHSTTVSFRFASKRSKYMKYMFRSEDLFMQALIYALPSSSTMSESMSPNQAKEASMKSRLIEWCQRNNLVFRPSLNNFTTIDCYINNIPIQLKYVTCTQGAKHTFYVGMKKNAGLNSKGKPVYRSYSISDPFEYVVCELGGTKASPSVFHSNFCLIPKAELASRGILQSTFQKGQLSMSIAPPKHPHPHWSSSFWNRIDLFQSPITRKRTRVADNKTVHSAKRSRTTLRVNAPAAVEFGSEMRD